MTAQLGASVRALVVFTVLLGLAYPLALTGVAKVAFPGRADGSLVEVDGAPVGSSLLGQAFTDAGGAPLPQYFQSRPSAGGYDPRASGASNLGPESTELLDQVCDRSAAAGELEGVDGGRPSCSEDGPADPPVPPDAVTASGSGLDPHISPEWAELQVPRVAAERGLAEAEVRALVEEHTQGRTLGFLGEPRVGVLELNLALDGATP